MKIPASDAIREKLAGEGLGYLCDDGFVEVDDDAFQHFAAMVDDGYQHASKEERIAITVVCCVTHPNHRPKPVAEEQESYPPAPVPEVDLSRVYREMRALRILYVVATVLILLVLFATRAHAQGTSQIDIITFEHSDGSKAAVYAAPFRLIEGTNITFAKGSCPGTTCGKLIVTGSSTAATAWSAITPTTNSQAGTFAASNNSWDFTASSLFKVRAKAGLTTSADGDLGYDTTAKVWHAWQNGADRYLFSSTNLGGSNQVCVWAANGTCTFAQLSYLQVSGLGGAAQLNVGTSSGTVAAGDDSRIVGALAASTVNSAYIVGKFNSGTCSGYLKSDGTCDVPATGAASSLTGAYIDWNSGSGGNSILNKPTLGSLAAKNAVDYSTTEVINKPTLGTAAALNVGTASSTVAAGDDSRITGALQSTALNSTLVVSKFGSGTCSGYLKSDGTCDIPTTGAASSLTGAYIDWNAGSGGASILNKPTLGSLAAKNSVDYSTSDITNKPTIPTTSNWPNGGSCTNQVMTGHANGSVPTCANIDYSGAIITNKPTLGTAAALNVPATGDAAAGEVVKGSDTRMTNARTPTSHSHAESEITSLTTDLAAKESASNKSTTTTLGTSDTLYPSQNAVKSYVDTGLATKAASNASTTVNSQTCALGGSCTITATASPAGSSGNLQTNNGSGGLGSISTTISGSDITFPGAVSSGATTDQSLELPNATSPVVSSASSVKLSSQSNKLMVSENTAAAVEVAKVNSNITGTAAGVTGKTLQGNGTLLPLATGTATASKQLTYDASGNIIASSYDVGAASGGYTGVTSDGSNGLNVVGKVSTGTSGSATGELKVYEGASSGNPGAGYAKVFVDASHNFTCVYGASSTPCVFPSGSMVYPGAGISISTGAAWGTSKTVQGNGTAIATVTGTATQNKQLAFDANGNIVASASDIGSGGSMTWPAAGGIAVYSGSSTWGTSITWNSGTSTMTGNISGNAGGTSAGLAAQYIDWNSNSGGNSIANKPTLGGAALLNVGTGSNTVAAGDDSRITGALQSSSLTSTLVVSKFGSGTCSGYLKSDGSCDTPTGSSYAGVTSDGANGLNVTGKVNTTTSGTGYLEVAEGTSPGAAGAGKARFYVDGSHNFKCEYGASPTACVFPSGSMVYPGSGIAVSTGGAWDTSKTAPTGVIVGTTDTQALTNKDLTGTGNLFPTFNQNTSGTAAGITGKTLQGTGTLVPLATGTATASKQLTYDASGNIIASSYDVGAASGGYSGVTSDGSNGLTITGSVLAAEVNTSTAGTGFLDLFRGSAPTANQNSDHNRLYFDASGNLACVAGTGGACSVGGGATPAGNSGDLQTNNGSGGLGAVAQSTFATAASLASYAPLADPNFTGTVDIDTGLNIGGATILTGNPVGIAGTTNGYIQVNIQNKSNGTTASSDYVATADSGSDTTNYIDLGINSSGYTNAAYNIGGALSGYLYTNGGDLTIGTQTAAKVVKFHTGGTTSDKLRVTINDTALIASGINDGLASITLTNSTPVAMGGTYNTGYYYNQHGTAATAVTYTLPATAAGKQYCVKNSIVGGTGAADTGVITVNPAASSYLIKDGTIGTVSKGISSGGAAGDGACFVAIDATHWEVYVQKGAWTLIP